MEKVIVYGTLKKGESNHHWMKQAKGKYLGNTEIQGYVIKCIKEYPYPFAMVDDKKSRFTNSLCGEVYEVEDKGIKVLDTLEGYPGYYDRTLVDTVYGKAWIYYVHELPKTTGEIVTTSEWTKDIVEFLGNRENLVWYLSYGSNISLIRFMYYILGRNDILGPLRRGCNDKRLPEQSLLVKFNNEIFFDRYAYIGRARAKIPTIGRIYLITLEQYEQIRTLEGSQYQTEYDFGVLAGYPVKSFTCSEQQAVIHKSGDRKMYLDYFNLISDSLHKMASYNDISDYIHEIEQHKKVCSSPDCRYEDVSIDRIVINEGVGKEFVEHRCELLDLATKLNPIIELELRVA